MTESPASEVANPVTPPPAKDPMQALAQMSATAEETETATLPAADMSGIDTSRIPELPSVESTKIGRAMTERLTPEELAIAKQIVEKEKLEDTMEIDRFGTEYQDNARKITKEGHKFLRENVKAAELGELGELAQEMNRKFRELGLGDLKWWEKIAKYIPFVKIDKLQDFIDGRQSMAGLMGDIREATYNKAVDVELFYHRLESKIKEVKTTVKQLSIVGAVIEMKITATEDQYRKETERLKKLGKLDDEDLELIHGMKQTLAALDMKLAHVKAMRTMMRQSGENFKMVREGMGIAVTKLKNQVEIQDIIWTTKIDEAIAIRELQKANIVVQAGREFTDKLIAIDAENLDEACKTIMEEAGKPGVSIELLVKSAEAQRVLANAINQAFVDNRKKLMQVAAKFDELEEKSAEGGTDLQTLMKMLDVAKLGEAEESQQTVH